MTPHLGQGACQALLDADALARALGESVDVPTALARYDRERNRAGRRYAAGSRAVGRLAHASAAAPPRDVVLRGIGALMQRRPVLSVAPTNTPRRWPGRASPTGSGRARSPARHR
ncbi:MAG: FAD-dependent oxidoreductase [Nocardioidaceae bacterium]